MYLIELCPSLLLIVTCHILHQQGLDCHSQSQYRFGTGNQVKRYRKCPSLLKVREPEFGTCKLPLNIGVILEKGVKRNEESKQVGEVFQPLCSANQQPVKFTSSVCRCECR